MAYVCGTDVLSTLMVNAGFVVWRNPALLSVAWVPGYTPRGLRRVVRLFGGLQDRTSCLVRSLLALVTDTTHGEHDNRRQDAEDRDHDQELDERKTRLP